MHHGMKRATQILLGLNIFILLSTACKTGSGGSSLHGGGAGADMQAIDKNGQAINCYADENRFWALSKTRKTLRVGVEGEGLLKKVTAHKVTSASASYTSAAGTLVITPSTGTWTEAGGQPEEITCELGAKVSAPTTVSSGSVKKLQDGFDKLSEENNHDLRNPEGSKELKPSELKGDALKFYKFAAAKLKADGIDGPSIYSIKVADQIVIAVLYDNQGNGNLGVFSISGAYLTNRDFSESEDLGWSTDGMGPLTNSK